MSRSSIGAPLFGCLLTVSASAQANETPRTACDGMSGKPQLSCIQDNYPNIAAKVEELCSGHEQPRQCRQREFAARNIQFTPGSSNPSTAPAGGSSAKPPNEEDRTEPPQPTYMTIRFVGVQIGPGKTNGSNWDGPGTIPDEALEGALALWSGGTTLAAGGDAGNIASQTIRMASQGADAPEVIGWVAFSGTIRPDLRETAGARMALATTARKVQDSYTPTFAYQMEYRNWPILPDTRFEVQLWDADMQDHDPIGVFQLNPDHLLAALDKKSICEIPVADQTSGQVLTVKISVTPGAGKGAVAQMNGYRY